MCVCADETIQRTRKNLLTQAGLSGCLVHLSVKTVSPIKCCEGAVQTGKFSVERVIFAPHVGQCCCLLCRYFVHKRTKIL